SARRIHGEDVVVVDAIGVGFVIRDEHDLVVGRPGDGMLLAIPFRQLRLVLTIRTDYVDVPAPVVVDAGPRLVREARDYERIGTSRFGPGISRQVGYPFAVGRPRNLFTDAQKRERLARRLIVNE